ncbi:hypothetical protein RCJ22_08990, partial [Vibrio sp. FNV 38]|nr:hypothetical protein [Vibrio sp. FNV 38]
HNLSVAAAEDGNDVVFLHNIIEGPASKSYGIHVARIAGIPEVIRQDARLKLNELEALSAEVRGDSAGRTEQISFMSDELAEEGISADAAKYRHLASKIGEIDINTMTPVSALVKLQEMVESTTETTVSPYLLVTPADIEADSEFMDNAIASVYSSVHSSRDGKTVT